MKIVKTTAAAGLLAASTLTHAEPIQLGFGVEVESGSPQAAVGQTVANIVNSLALQVDPTANNTELLDVLTLVIDNPSTAEAALQALSPKINSSNTSFIKKAPGFDHLQGMGRRLAAMRRGVSFAYRDGKTRRSRNTSSTVLSNNGIEAGGLLDNRLSTFITGDFLYSSQNETETEAGFSGNIGRLTAGADYRLTNNFFAGGYASIMYGSLALDNNGGALTADEERISVFASYYPAQNIYLNVALGSALRHFDLERKIQFSIAGSDYVRTANSSPDGNNMEVQAELGSDLDLGGGALINIHTRARYGQSVISSFTESDGGGFSLSVDEQQVQNISVGAGVQLGMTISTSWSVLSPYLRGNYMHEFASNGDEIRAKFVYDPGNNYFSYKVQDTDADYIDIAAGTTVIMAGGISAFVQASTLLLFDNYSRVAVVAGARSEF
ncbi:MAG: autotransporter outer membrane beta-barrel domain-containing protein [Gammaproteobacteria bacterium]|nr:autotransporter outer membrane beta-barrel domain-containing protein [Gammaproteobacteria bacterium]